MRALGKWSIKNNVSVNLIMIFIIMAGIFTVMKMRREMFPQFSLDMIVCVGCLSRLESGGGGRGNLH